MNKFLLYRYFVRRAGSIPPYVAFFAHKSELYTCTYLGSFPGKLFYIIQILVVTPTVTPNVIVIITHSYNPSNLTAIVKLIFRVSTDLLCNSHSYENVTVTYSNI